MHANLTLLEFIFFAVYNRIFRNVSGAMPSGADLDAIIDRSKMMQVAPNMPDPCATHIQPKGHLVTNVPSVSLFFSAAKAALGAAAAATASVLMPRSRDMNASIGVALRLLPGMDVASSSAGGVVSRADAMLSLDTQHSAQTYAVVQTPISTFSFCGKDFAALRGKAGKDCDSFRDIALQVCGSEELV